MDVRYMIAKAHSDLGHTDRAMSICESIIKSAEEKGIPKTKTRDAKGLIGGLYKGRFMDSCKDRPDEAALEKAINAYREVHQMERTQYEENKTIDLYGTINVLTLLFASKR